MKTQETIELTKQCLRMLLLEDMTKWQVLLVTFRYLKGTTGAIEDRQAATKLYVDNASYAPTEDLYVTKQGDDTQKIPDLKVEV